jgi:hypothetical protein
MSFLGRDDREAAERPVSQGQNPLARRLGAAATPVPTVAGTSQPAAAPMPTEAATPARTIGRLQKLGAQELWGTDSKQVVTWLRSNLEPLGEAIDVVLTPASAAEVPGSTNALLAAERGGGGVLVVVELGASTDDHFGVLVRQMVASTAKTAVWVTGDPRPDHLASVSWLNRSVDGRFYVVQLEAVRIGDSAAAPVFTTVLRPPRATDAVDESRRPGAAPDGELGRRAEDWSEARPVEEAGA